MTYLGLTGRLIVAGALVAPLLALAVLALNINETNAALWSHLAQTILWNQFSTTLILMCGVALATASIGTATAWLVSFCDFPARRLLAWGLYLPLAIPTYIAAYSYSDLADSASAAASLWRDAGLPAALFPDIYSLGGFVIILSLVLYPYVYLSARTAFVQQSAGLTEAARASGATPFQCFWRVGLPHARPAIVAGVALALMECLNDIGAAEHLGIQTLTIGVYDTWVVRGSLAGAAQMALTLLAFVGVLLYLERRQRGARSFAPIGGRKHAAARFALTPIKSFGAFIICAAPLALGFILPLAHLISIAEFNNNNIALLNAAEHSFMLALAAALLVSAVALLLAFGNRINLIARNLSRLARIENIATRIATLGYAIPGTILGLGVLAVFGSIAGVASVASVGVAALLFAYAVRFAPLAFNAIENGFARIPQNQTVAAKTLGANGWRVLRKIYIPHLQAPLALGALLVFVDVAKELPATLLLRPFNFETLASLTYTHASLGEIESAAAPALLIVSISLFPVLFLLARFEQVDKK